MTQATVQRDGCGVAIKNKDRASRDSRYEVPAWHGGKTEPEDWQYYDFKVISSEGLDRLHGNQGYEREKSDVANYIAEGLADGFTLAQMNVD